MFARLWQSDRVDNRTVQVRCWVIVYLRNLKKAEGENMRHIL